MVTRILPRKYCGNTLLVFHRVWRSVEHGYGEKIHSKLGLALPTL